MRIRLIVLAFACSIFATAIAKDPLAYSDLNLGLPVAEYAETFWDGALNTYSEDTGQFQFQASATGSLSNITMAAGNGDFLFFDPNPKSFNVILWADFAGVPGAVPLGTWSGETDGAGAQSLAPSDYVSINVAGGPILTAGSFYWMGVSSSDPTTNLYDEISWDTVVGAPDQVNYLQGVGDGFYGPPAGFSVSVNAVPEPKVPCLVGVAFVGMARLRRSRRQARTIR